MANTDTFKKRLFRIFTPERHAAIDYDEATKQEIFSDEEEDSGDQVLFAIL
jgi:hypothetical protein